MTTAANFSYKGWTINYAIGAIMANDMGCDSGVKDDLMKQAIKNYLHSLKEDELRVVIAKFAREMLTDEALAQRYGIEDVVGFLKWLDSEMGLGDFLV